MVKFQGITMPECTVQLWYNKQRIKKDGKASLYLQVIVNSEHIEVKLKNLQWPAENIDWNKKALLARSKDDLEVLTYNALIERERAKYWAVVMDFLKRDIAFTMADIFREVNRFKSGHLFCEFMEQAILERQRTTIKKDMIKEGTAGVHKSTLVWFRDYLENIDIEITRIDGDLLEDFADHLRPHMVENTVWVKIQNIKSYLSYAFRHKIAVNHDYKRCIITPDEADPVWLEEHEMNALLDLYWDDKVEGHHKRNLRAFLFACYTGLRISDLSRWNKDWIKKDHIEFIPKKRRKSARIPKPLEIPIGPHSREFIDDLYSESFDLPEDQVYNRGLKELAVKAGIDKNLTSHVARHTFATNMAIDGVEVLMISKLMGHKSTKTTDIYIHIAKQHLAKAMIRSQQRFRRRGDKPTPPEPPEN